MSKDSPCNWGKSPLELRTHRLPSVRCERVSEHIDVGSSSFNFKRSYCRHYSVSLAENLGRRCMPGSWERISSFAVAKLAIVN